MNALFNDALAAEHCRETARRLTEAEVPTEGLAEFVPASRRLWVFPRPATMRAIDEVWRLGRLLLGLSGELYAAGRTTRAAERGRPGYQSLSREERKEIAAAALHGGYPVGATVNFDAAPLSLAAEFLRALDATSPLGLDGSTLRVRWRAGAALAEAPTLEHYLRERSELLIKPPLGAT